MELVLAPEILKTYGYTKENVIVKQIGSGLINRTYLLSPISEERQFILQHINTKVFENPEAIANNLRAIAAYLTKNYPNYNFIKPILTLNGEEMAFVNGEYWRMLPFVEDTISLDVLSNPKQAFEAAKQFGKLSKLLDGFEVNSLKQTIVGFHDLNQRYKQFVLALNETTTQLKQMAKSEIDFAIDHKYVLDYFNSFKESKYFPDRVMHHDTKISNVLLDKSTYEGICVIDLDTIMPGKFISDLGDMMRTYLCAFSENETDLSKIKIRLPYFEAMIKGYLSEMKNSLTDTEKELILFSGKYMIYMQALRFLTDFLNENIYYPVNYFNQNLDRAKNQFKLLSELSLNEKELQEIIEENLA